jgi:hypothetical protein
MPKRKLSDDQLQQMLLDSDGGSDSDRAENEDLSASCSSDSEGEAETPSVSSARVLFAQPANPPSRAHSTSSLQVCKQITPKL